MCFLAYFSLRMGSKPTVGSSNINRVGLCRRAIASETLRCWPPLQIKKYFISVLVLLIFELNLIINLIYMSNYLTSISRGLC